MKIKFKKQLKLKEEKGNPTPLGRMTDQAKQSAGDARRAIESHLQIVKQYGSQFENRLGDNWQDFGIRMGESISEIVGGAVTIMLGTSMLMSVGAARKYAKNEHGLNFAREFGRQMGRHLGDGLSHMPSLTQGSLANLHGSVKPRWRHGTSTASGKLLPRRGDKTNSEAVSYAAEIKELEAAALSKTVGKRRKEIQEEMKTADENTKSRLRSELSLLDVVAKKATADSSTRLGFYKNVVLGAGVGLGTLIGLASGEDSEYGELGADIASYSMLGLLMTLRWSVFAVTKMLEASSGAMTVVGMFQNHARRKMVSYLESGGIDRLSGAVAGASQEAYAASIRTGHLKTVNELQQWETLAMGKIEAHKAELLTIIKETLPKIQSAESKEAADEALQGLASRLGKRNEQLNREIVNDTASALARIGSDTQAIAKSASDELNAVAEFLAKEFSTGIAYTPEMILKEVVPILAGQKNEMLKALTANYSQEAVVAQIKGVGERYQDVSKEILKSMEQIVTGRNSQGEAFLVLPSRGDHGYRRSSRRPIIVADSMPKNSSGGIASVFYESTSAVGVPVASGRLKQDALLGVQTKAEYVVHNGKKKSYSELVKEVGTHEAVMIVAEDRAVRRLSVTSEAESGAFNIQLWKSHNDKRYEIFGQEVRAEAAAIQVERIEHLYRCLADAKAYSPRHMPPSKEGPMALEWQLQLEAAGIPVKIIPNQVGAPQQGFKVEFQIGGKWVSQQDLQKHGHKIYRLMLQDAKLTSAAYYEGAMNGAMAAARQTQQNIIKGQNSALEAKFAELAKERKLVAPIPGAETVQAGKGPLDKRSTVDVWTEESLYRYLQTNSVDNLAFMVERGKFKRRVPLSRKVDDTGAAIDRPSPEFLPLKPALAKERHQAIKERFTKEGEFQVGSFDEFKAAVSQMPELQALIGAQKYQYKKPVVLLSMAEETLINSLRQNIRSQALFKTPITALAFATVCDISPTASFERAFGFENIENESRGFGVWITNLARGNAEFQEWARKFCFGPGEFISGGGMRKNAGDFYLGVFKRGVDLSTETMGIFLGKTVGETIQKRLMPYLENACKAAGATGLNLVRGNGPEREIGRINWSDWEKDLKRVAQTDEKANRLQHNISSQINNLYTSAGGWSKNNYIKSAIWCEGKNRVPYGHELVSAIITQTYEKHILPAMRLYETIFGEEIPAKRRSGIPLKLDATAKVNGQSVSAEKLFNAAHRRKGSEHKLLILDLPANNVLSQIARIPGEGAEATLRDSLKLGPYPGRELKTRFAGYEPVNVTQLKVANDGLEADGKKLRKALDILGNPGQPLSWADENVRRQYNFNGITIDIKRVDVIVVDELKITAPANPARDWSNLEHWIVGTPGLGAGAGPAELFQKITNFPHVGFALDFSAKWNTSISEPGEQIITKEGLVFEFSKRGGVFTIK